MQNYIATPDYYNEYIAHYGIKGMKWRKRKAKNTVRAISTGSRAGFKAGDAASSKADEKLLFSTKKSDYDLGNYKKQSAIEKAFARMYRRWYDEPSVYTEEAKRLAKVIGDAIDREHELKGMKKKKK